MQDIHRLSSQSERPKKHYPVLKYILTLDIHCFGTGFKMASRFVTVSKDEILAVNEAVAPTNTKKETKFGLLVFTGH